MRVAKIASPVRRARLQTSRTGLLRSLLAGSAVFWPRASVAPRTLGSRRCLLPHSDIALPDLRHGCCQSPPRSMRPAGCVHPQTRAARTHTVSSISLSHARWCQPALAALRPVCYASAFTFPVSAQVLAVVLEGHKRGTGVLALARYDPPKPAGAPATGDEAGRAQQVWLISGGEDGTVRGECPTCASAHRLRLASAAHCSCAFVKLLGHSAWRPAISWAPENDKRARSVEC